jgi:hypothetical protein
MPETNKKIDKYCDRKKKNSMCLNYVKKTNAQSNNKSSKMRCAAKIKAWSKN